MRRSRLLRPLAARRDVGQLLRLLQDGESIGLPHSRPMPSIGPRCHELRVRDVGANWRIIYRIDDDAIVVVHVFAKKTQTTPMRVIDLCKRRLKDLDARSSEGDAMEIMKGQGTERAGKDAVEAKKGAIETTVQEWLDLDDVDMKVIDFRASLVKAIRRKREGSNVTQVALAKQIGTSQPNIAKIEAGGVGVSLDLLLRVFFATGGQLLDLVRFPAAS